MTFDTPVCRPTAVASRSREGNGDTPRRPPLPSAETTRPPPLVGDPGWTPSSGGLVGGTVGGPYLKVPGRTRAGMWLGIYQIVLLMGGLIGLGRFGPLWACDGVGLAFATYTLVSLLVIRAFDGVEIGRLMLRCSPPLLACVPMVLGIRALRVATFAMHLPTAVQLGMEVVAGGVLYVGSAFVVARPLARELIETVRDARRRRHETDSVPPPSLGAGPTQAAETKAD